MANGWNNCGDLVWYWYTNLVILHVWPITQMEKDTQRLLVLFHFFMTFLANVEKVTRIRKLLMAKMLKPTSNHHNKPNAFMMMSYELIQIPQFKIRKLCMHIIIYINIDLQLSTWFLYEICLKHRVSVSTVAFLFSNLSKKKSEIYVFIFFSFFSLLVPDPSKCFL